MNHTVSMEIDRKALRNSFMKLAPHKTKLARVFYDGLLSKHPEFSAAFSGIDWHTQQEMLMGSLSLVIKHIAVDNPDPNIMISLQHIGHRHAQYNLNEDHLILFINHLILTMKFILQESWSVEIENDWRAALWSICLLMLKAIKEEELK